ncbi:hypothetical protein LOZ80_29885 [Paenibacillus sp. HWE-109]|uniref:hypothetical protein n=1 Tax=Paenibacillus sp. HWE-109 TaxID=1306526 RepID=UPI001EDEC1BC|nr:hypothetical protein [Paenibacillus sp. HWE-109]UKS25732.1 hypothetical protein LOZ80_29885 [Paenibacillus sp. HWE-109]
MSSKPIKKTRATYKKASATAKQANRKTDLGNGFQRFFFNRTITPNTFFTFTFLGGSLKPISGGFFIANQNSLPAYATSFYNQSDTTYIITVFNPTSVTRAISFTFVAKQ